MGVSGCVNPSRALPPGKGPPVPIGQGAEWASEPVWTQRLEGKILLPLPGIERRSPGRPVRSQTLYWSSNPGSLYLFMKTRRIRHAMWRNYSDVAANVRHVWRVLRSCDVEKLSSDRGDCSSKKCKRGSDGAYGGVWQSAFGGSLESGSRCCVGASGPEYGFSRCDATTTCFKVQSFN
jgi:hypothetical protein